MFFLRPFGLALGKCDTSGEGFSEIPPDALTDRFLCERSLLLQLLLILLSSPSAGGLWLNSLHSRSRKQLGFRHSAAA